MNIKIYTSDCMRTKGVVVWLYMFKELWSSRELVQRLIIRDISVRYRQSIFGYLWALAPQIVTVAIFTFMARHRIFDIGETQLPYVIHALWSISLWQLFSSCLIRCTSCLVNAGSLVTKINFPKEVLVISALGQPIFDFMIRLLPVSIVMIWYGFVPSSGIIFIPFILMLVILLALGIGFILSIINLIFRDIANAISILLTFGLFLAPILYPPPVTDTFSLINTINPFSPLLIATQELLLGSDITYLYPLLVVGFLSIFIFLIGWRIFHITMPRAAERA
jgi:lipopolysaccharide transport system permease protein